MIDRLSRSAPLAVLIGVQLCPAAAATPRPDRVVTVDGRVLEAKKARQQDGGYTLEFEHGTIVLEDDRHVTAVEIEGDMSDYVPANDNEREKLEKGFVRYRGKWIHKAEYELQIERDNEKSREEAAAAAANSKWANALRKETKHFQFVTNTGQELLERYAALLEAYWKLMDDRIGIDPTPTMKRTKMTVNIYKSHEEFLKKTGTENPAVLGFFHPGEQTLNFSHSFVEPEKSQWVALHECTHLLTFLIDQQYQPQIWINEAVADYFGSAEIKEGRRGKLEIEPGRMQTDRILTVQQALKDRSAIELKDLFFISRDDFHGFEYAHAWSFVYFLNNFNKGKYAKGFAKFFKDLYTTAKGVPYETEPGPGNTGVAKVVSPEDIRDLLLKKIKVKDVDQLGAQWHEYIGGLEINAPEARLKRGLRAVQMFELDEALTDLDIALGEGLDDARGYWGRARALLGLHMMPPSDGAQDPDGAQKAGQAAEVSPLRALSVQERREQAEKDLRRAVELDPLNAQYRYELSLALLGRVAFVKYEVEGEQPTLSHAEAKSQAGLASELDSKNPDYQDWLKLFE